MLYHLDIYQQRFFISVYQVNITTKVRLRYLAIRVHSLLRLLF